MLKSHFKGFLKPVLKLHKIRGNVMEKYGAPKNRAKRYTELKKQSLKQSGIQDLTIIYDNWTKSNKVEQVHQEIKEFSYITFYSADTSNPKSFF